MGSLKQIKQQQEKTQRVPKIETGVRRMKTILKKQGEIN